MRVHQERWSKSKVDVLKFNTLSCFQCTELCEHYFLREVVYEPVVDVDDRKNNFKEKKSDSNGEQKIHKEKSIDCNLGQKDSNLIEIVPSNNDSDFTVGDWFAVQFDMEEGRHQSRKFIGCITEKNGSEFTAKVVSEKNTKYNNGYVLHFSRRQMYLHHSILLKTSS